jgi:TRAP-type C4-dicarboxylate transport system substrate-binding protein
MMKKTRTLLVLGLAVVVFLAAGASLFAADQGKVKLRMQTHLIPTQMKRTVTTFVEDVAAATKGTVEITLFPVNSIVPQKELMDAVSRGTVDMALYPEGAWFKTVPVSEVAAGIPFTLRDLDEAKTLMFKKGLLELLREGYAKYNLYIIPHETYPIDLMTKKPIRKAEDIRGMKLRAYGTMADMLGKLGASTTLIPGGELYTALATGVVDGAHWGDAGPSYEMKLHEILKFYLTPEPVQGSWNNVMINMDVWKKLTPEQRSGLEKTILANGEIAFKASRELTKMALEDMQKKWKVEVVKLPPAEIAKLEKVAEQHQNEIAKKDPLCAKAVAILTELEKNRGK